MPTIQEQGIQYLGKYYDSILKDSGNLQDTMAQLYIWLKVIDNNQLLEKFNLWCFQCGEIVQQIHAKMAGCSPNFQLGQPVQQVLQAVLTSIIAGGRIQSH